MSGLVISAPMGGWRTAFEVLQNGRRGLVDLVDDRLLVWANVVEVCDENEMNLPRTCLLLFFRLQHLLLSLRLGIRGLIFDEFGGEQVPSYLSSVAIDFYWISRIPLKGGGSFVFAVRLHGNLKVYFLS